MASSVPLAPRSISDPPADKQVVEHAGKRYRTIKEGLAYILVPDTAGEEGENKNKNKNKEKTSSKTKDAAVDDDVQQVFYNPIQQFNRDLTVLAIKAYGKERMEQKKAQSKARVQDWTAKKRKWKEPGAAAQEEQQSRPAKAQKLADDAEEGGKRDGNGEAVKTTEGGEQETKRVETGEREIREQETVVVVPKAAAKSQRFTILDALSASGLRALRYAHEIPFVTSVTSNDLTKSAVESIKLNVEHNRLQDKIRVTHDDALAHMYSLVAAELRQRQQHPASITSGGKAGGGGRSEKYDVIDLDPYGTAAPFLDAAVQAVRDDGGLLCVTCTDAGVWASNGYPEKCYSLYGGVPVKGFFSHEAGLRIIIHAIESSAARYGLAVEPLLSLSIDYYCRIFVRVRKSPASVKFQGGKNMVVYNCDAGCGAWATQLLMRNKAAPNKRGTGLFYKHGFAAAPAADRACEHCGATMHLAGPMYAGRIQSPPFIRRVLAELRDATTTTPVDSDSDSAGVYGTAARIEGMLQTALEEVMLSREEIEMEMEMDASGPAAAEEGKDKENKNNSSNSVPKDAELATIDPYPFFVHPAGLARSLHCATPSESAVRGALVGLGYRVTRSHCKPGSIKTDAPWAVVWRVMREWVRQKAPVTEGNIAPGTAGYRLLGLDGSGGGGGGSGGDSGGEGEKGKGKKGGEEEIPGEVVFDEKLGRDPDKNKFMRYQINPRENWGPMNRAKGW